MEWASGKPEHRVLVKEVMVHDGVDKLRVICKTCDRAGLLLAEFSKETHPKYRLALKAADAVVKEHLEKVLDTDAST